MPVSDRVIERFRRLTECGLGMQNNWRFGVVWQSKYNLQWGTMFWTSSQYQLHWYGMAHANVLCRSNACSQSSRMQTMYRDRHELVPSCRSVYRKQQLSIYTWFKKNWRQPGRPVTVADPWKSDGGWRFTPRIQVEIRTEFQVSENAYIYIGYYGPKFVKLAIRTELTHTSETRELIWNSFLF